jgi:FkbM family methyltransferase
MSLPSLRAAHNKSSRFFGKWAAILAFLLFSVIVTLLASHADTQVFLLNIGEAEDDQSRTTPPCKIDDYFTSHQEEFKNIDLKGDAVKTMAVPESSLMDAVLESQPTSKNNPRVTMIDIGGNMGDMSAMMRAKWGPEPKIHIYDVIQAFVQKLSNRFKEDSQIQVHHNALSSMAGETVKILGSRDWLKKNAFHTGASVLSRGGRYDAVIEEVATTTIDTIVESNSPLVDKPGSIPFCKIDTEGNDCWKW